MSRSLRTAGHKIGWELRTLAGMSPRLSRWLVRSGEVTTAETEICIEGFPRSGNTFAVIAFIQAQPRVVSVAHHAHAPGSLITAVHLGKPAVVLIREPEEAVLSYVVRDPMVSIARALRGYARFYRPLLPYRDRLVVGRFEDVTADLGPVIAAVNARFGTSFEPFRSTAADLARVAEELDRWDRQAFEPTDRFELERATPTEARDLAKDELRPAYRSPRLGHLRAVAERLHAVFTHPH